MHERLPAAILGEDVARREVQDVEDDEGGRDDAGDHHRPRSQRGAERLDLGVGVRAGAAIVEREADGGIHVQGRHREQAEPEGPEALFGSAEEHRVMVERLGAGEHLEVTQHVDDDKREQGGPRDAHHEFSPNRTAQQIREDIHKI